MENSRLAGFESSQKKQKSEQSDMTLRRLIQDEAKYCVEVDNFLNSEAAGGLVLWDLKSHFRAMQLKPTRSGPFQMTTVYFGAFRETTMIGYASVRTTIKKKKIFEYFIENIAVVPHERRNG